ncbi:MAG: hypothetical protein AAF363_14475 [Bacteroidota bacterium]
MKKLILILTLFPLLSLAQDLLNVKNTLVHTSGTLIGTIESINFTIQDYTEVEGIRSEKLLNISIVNLTTSLLGDGAVNITQQELEDLSANVSKMVEMFPDMVKGKDALTYESESGFYISLTPYDKRTAGIVMIKSQEPLPSQIINPTTLIELDQLLKKSLQSF